MRALLRDKPVMNLGTVPILAAQPDSETGEPPSRSMSCAQVATGETREMRLRRLVREHFQFCYRSLRALGVCESDLDDATQRVFLVLANKLSDVEPKSERAFLFSLAIRVASHARRSQRRKRETLMDAVPERVDRMQNPEERALESNARQLLGDILEKMPIDLRAVFVLFELEEMSSPEIAKTLGLPVGTVASRLRKARDVFREHASRLTNLPKGPPR